MSNRLDVLLKPNSNKNNKKILKYLHMNQQKINNNNIYISPVVVEDDIIDEFVKIGVKNLPSIMYKKDIIYGVDDIIEYIDSLCNKPIQKEKNTEDYDNDLHNYMIKMATEDDSGIEDPITQDEIKKSNNKFSQNNNTVMVNKKQNRYDEDTDKLPTISEENDDDILEKYYNSLK